MLRTYPGDSLSNLQIFINKLSSDNKQESKSRINIDEIKLSKGEFVFDQENQSTQKINNINLVLNKAIYNVDNVEVSISEGSLFQSDLGELTSISAQLKIKKSQIELTELMLEGDGLLFESDVHLRPAQKIHDSLGRSIFFENLKMRANLDYFPGLAPQLKPNQIIELEGNLVRYENLIRSQLKLKFGKKSQFSGRFEVGFEEKEISNVESVGMDFRIHQSDVASLLTTKTLNQFQWNQLNFNQLIGNSTFSYKPKKSININSTIRLKEGIIVPVIKGYYRNDSWNLHNELGVDKLALGELINKPLLESVSGNASFDMQIAENHPLWYEGKFNLNTINFSGNQLQHIEANFKNNSKIRWVETTIDDPNLKFHLRFDQQKNKRENFRWNSEFKYVDLSAFGFTNQSSKTILSIDLKGKGTTDLHDKIAVSSLLISNSDQKYTFEDFEFQFNHSNKGKNTLSITPSDALDLSLSGKFKYLDFPMLFQNAVSEAFLISQRNPLEEPSALTFNIQLKEKLIQALYPNLTSTEGVHLKGNLNTKQGASSLRLNLPYLQLGEYRFDSVFLETHPNTTPYAAVLKVEKLEVGNVKMTQVEALAQRKNKGLNTSLKGNFGKDFVNVFNFNFNHRLEGDKSQFKLLEGEMVISDNHWVFQSPAPQTLIYNFLTKQIKINQLRAQTNQQSFDVSMRFNNLTDFDLNLNLSKIDLAEILPESDKFNFKGQLTGEVKIVQNTQEKSAQAKFDLTSFVINDVKMGDLKTTLSGIPQLNAYQIDTTINGISNTPLQGNGVIRVIEGKPNLNLDLSLDSFDLSFLSPLGKENLKDIKGFLSGDLNLWGDFNDLKLNGKGEISRGGIFVPSINVRYEFGDESIMNFQNNTFELVNTNVTENQENTSAVLSGLITHRNFKAWELSLGVRTDRLMIFNQPEDPGALFYGQGFLNGQAKFEGPLKSLTLMVNGSSASGTSLVIPWQEDKGLSDTSFIDFIDKDRIDLETIDAGISSFDEDFRGFEMIFDLDVNNEAQLEIVVDQSSGSTLSGRGAGNVLIETNIDGKFNIWGDFITYEGVYNFKNLGLIDKKFSVNQGGTIVWEGDPLDAQLNIDATYQVPGGANPALLVDNPNFNRKIPTEVTIQLRGNLIKPDDPVFDISFPNTTGIVSSEINYRLADEQRRQLQAISLLSQGIFISDVSVSFQGITNNLYEKASDVFSTLLGTNEGKLNIGLNYLQGDNNPNFNLQTEDRIGLTLSTQLSDRILINGKIGVPVDGVQETLIVGDVQIDFILNDSGTLKAKVFNRENEFRYLGDELGYTQGMGMSYQVDFNSFRQLLEKIKNKSE